MTPGVTLNQSIDERIKEFRSDPQKMDITTKFVNDVVEEAKDEVMKRMKERDKVEAMNPGSEPTRKRGRWHSRARGFFSRLLASFCFCSPETKSFPFGRLLSPNFLPSDLESITDHTHSNQSSCSKLHLFFPCATIFILPLLLQL